MHHRHLLLALLLASSTTYAAPSEAVPDRVLPPFEFHASIDKQDAQISFDKGAVGGMVNKEELSGILAMTGDFTPAPVHVMIVFAPSVTEQRLTKLVNFQGRLTGVAQCQHVRVGSSPLYPQYKTVAVGESCIIKSINH